MEQETAIEVTNPRTGRKRDDIMLLEDRAAVARLLHEGITSSGDIQARINHGRPEDLQVSVETIRNDIAWIRNKWKESAVIDYEAYANQVFEELEYLKSICYSELHKSQTPKTTVTEEASCPQDEIPAALAGEKTNAKVNRIITKEENREANVAYIQMIEKLIARQCALRGIDSPSKIAITNTKGEDITSAARASILSTLESMNKSDTEEELESEK